MIAITWKCRCMPEEAVLQVRNRWNSEDFLDWMRNVVQCDLGAAHAKRSPWCRSAKVEYAKIPAPETNA